MQHSTGTCGEDAALSLVRFHDGVHCALTLYRWQCLYLTTRFSLRARIQPPSRPACVIKTGLSFLLTNPKQSLWNRSRVQLLITSTSKPLPSMSSWDSDTNSNFVGSFSISFSNLCHGTLPFSDLSCSWRSLHQWAKVTLSFWHTAPQPQLWWKCRLNKSRINEFFCRDHNLSVSLDLTDLYEAVSEARQTVDRPFSPRTLVNLFFSTSRNWHFHATYCLNRVIYNLPSLSGLKKNAIFRNQCLCDIQVTWQRLKPLISIHSPPDSSGNNILLIIYLRVTRESVAFHRSCLLFRTVVSKYICLSWDSCPYIHFPDKCNEHVSVCTRASWPT